MSKFGDDIRRISKYQELLDMIRQEKQSDPTLKGAISGARSIAYQAALAAVAATPGVTKPDNNGAKDKPVKDGGDKEGEDKKDNSTDDSTSTTESGTSDGLAGGDNSDRDGWYDAESLLQGAKDGLGKSPPTDDFKINTITGASTAAGRKIVAHLKDAAVSFLAPNDRDSAFESVPDPDWSPNYYYSATNFAVAGEQGSTFKMAGARAAATMIGYPLSGGLGNITRTEFVSITQNPITGDGDYTINYYYSNGGPEQGPVSNNIGVTRGVCTSVASPSLYCTIVAPELVWADMGATQMAWVYENTPAIVPIAREFIGKFVPHPSDVNVPSTLQDGASILDLVTNIGNTIRLGPLAAGGWYLYYRDAVSGLPTGSEDSHTVYTINSDRTPGDYITPKQLSKILPYK